MDGRTLATLSSVAPGQTFKSDITYCAASSVLPLRKTFPEHVHALQQVESLVPPVPHGLGVAPGSVGGRKIPFT
jgi:hypothetical protein